MKRTQYFESVEAVNQYFPDGVPSTVIAIVGDGSNVFVSSDNAASGNQQYYSAEMTNDEIVAEQVSAAESQGYETGYAAGETAGYTAGETAGYEAGYTAGEAAGSTNWLDVLYLDEKTKAETALNVTEWSDSQKYNFANDAANDGSCVNPQTAPALITGVLQDATISKVIKISKDVNDNAVITYHNCYINFDGTNLGAISLDGVTYYNKMCIWSEPITLAVDDEIIWGVAASLSGTSIFLFGGYDPDAYEMVGEEGQTHKQWKAATYKCTTAGTYTFGMTIDVPQASNPQAIAFVSTMFNYEGSATVPAITVPTGETSGGGGTVAPNYLTFTALTSNAQIGMRIFGWYSGYTGFATDIQYSLDGGSTWTNYTPAVVSDDEDTTGVQYITLNIGDKIMFKGENSSFSHVFDAQYGDREYCSFTFNGLFDGSGDVTSLLNGVGGDVTLTEGYTFSNLFYGSGLVTSPNLPSTTLTQGCYESMFNGSTNLTKAPDLHATTLAASCYYGMFEDCSAMVLAMPILPATTLTSECYAKMFYNCTALVNTPVLPAATLTEKCYFSIFEGCDHVSDITCLATDITATNCVDRWLNYTAATGVLKKAATMSGWIAGTNIPEGWTTQNA